jgi:hypothetical protein
MDQDGQEILNGELVDGTNYLYSSKTLGRKITYKTTKTDDEIEAKEFGTYNLTDFYSIGISPLTVETIN